MQRDRTVSSRAAGEAAIADNDYYMENCRRIIVTREKTAARLRELIRASFKSAEVAIIPAGGLCSFYAETGGLLVGFEHAV